MELICASIKLIISASIQPDALCFSAGPDNVKISCNVLSALSHASSYVHVYGNRKGAFAEPVGSVSTKNSLAKRMAHLYAT